MLLETMSAMCGLYVRDHLCGFHMRAPRDVCMKTIDSQALPSSLDLRNLSAEFGIPEMIKETSKYSQSKALKMVHTLPILLKNERMEIQKRAFF